MSTHRSMYLPLPSPSPSSLSFSVFFVLCEACQVVSIRHTHAHPPAHAAAKQLGCTVVNIGAEDLSSAKSTLIMGLLWQIIKVCISLSCYLSVYIYVYLTLLQKSLLKNVSSIDAQEFEGAPEDASPEDLLLQWINHHLKCAHHAHTTQHALTHMTCTLHKHALTFRPRDVKCKRTVSNFASDLADSEAYIRLLQALAPSTVTEGERSE